jgi:hypothetical protein
MTVWNEMEKGMTFCFEVEIEDVNGIRNAIFSGGRRGRRGIVLSDFVRQVNKRDSDRLDRGNLKFESL